ncbi:MAG: S9 family peptidase [Alphaproteobacteria bacterium]|nr:MAG: S9 family peptidase [Alphaproteobacteria bacterium]
MGNCTNIILPLIVMRGCFDQMRRTAIIAWVLTLLVSAGAQAAPPVEAFGKLEDFSHVEISPTGKYLAAVRWADGAANLTIYNLAPGPGEEPVKALSLDFSDNVEEKIRFVRWLNEERVGVAVSFEHERWDQDTLETRLMSITADLSDVRQIPKLPKNRSSFVAQLQDRVLDFLPDDPDHILMEFDRNGLGQELNVYRVNVNDGTMEGVAFGNETVVGYIADREGQVRFKYAVQEVNNQVFKRALFYRSGDDKGWTLFQEIGKDENFDPRIAGFTNDPSVLYVLRLSEEGYDDLYTYNLTTRLYGNKVFGVEGIDVGSLVSDNYTRRVLGVSYAVDYTKIAYFDGQIASLQEAVDGVLRGTQNLIVGWDRSRTRFVIFATGPQHPGTYYIFDATTNNLSKLFDRYAYEFQPQDLTPVEPITYQARDGVTIPGYLTRRGGNGPMPMVVMPHGGPNARDFLGYEYFAQFLASRGYAVLQPNFRGSTGYGAAFEEAGFGEWGLLMQDDVTDGVRAMIDRGIADPERICIFGWSYGGYAALMGAIKTPELYKCVVSGAPVTDLRRILQENSKYKFAGLDQTNVGKYWKDAGKLRDTSPINNADLIQVPVLLIHGDKDLSVDVGHSKRMYNKLKGNGQDNKLVILEGGNHHLALEHNRVRALKELESFLKKNL